VCHLCEAIDEKIAHYRRLENQISDKQTLQGSWTKILREPAAAMHIDVHTSS
jgi:hypothetical protein